MTKLQRPMMWSIGRLLAVVGVAMSLAIGCASSDGANPYQDVQLTLSVGSGSVRLAIGESIAIGASVSTSKAGQAYTLSYTSGDPKTATVSPVGLITGRANGSATITIVATIVDTGSTATASVNVVVGTGDGVEDAGAPSSDAAATPPTSEDAGRPPPETTPPRFQVSCTGNITSALQTAINQAVDGDVIEVGAGNCSAGTVSWTNKNILVRGLGIGVSNVSGLSFKVTDTTKAGFRISGFSVGAPTSWLIDALNRTQGIKGWRIDHVAWSYPSCTQNIAVFINGINWGLLDHNTFDNAGNAVFVRAWADNTNEVNPWPPSGKPGMGGYSWLLPLNLGSDEAVYVEDNSFKMGTGCYFGVGDMYYGARMVFRYNKVTNAYWQNHAARGYERGGSLKAEIYNNDFNATDPAWSRAIHVRSGTGVVFNNTLRGSFNTIQVDNQRSNGQNTSAPFGACNGSSAWDGNTAGQAGWPCLDQIGRGPGQYPSQTSAPLYAWNNGGSLGCSSGGACTNPISMIGDGDSHVQAGRDFVNGATAKPGYAALVYPHPLQQ